MTKTQPRFARLSASARRQSLVEAGLACLARGGITEFTIDRISTEANVSRGLITHHFGSKDGLLAAVYEAMIGTLNTVIEEGGSQAQSPEDFVRAIIDSVFSLEILNRDSLKIWLALWGEIANNPELLSTHRQQYARYVGSVERAIQRVADSRGGKVEARQLAVMFVSLVDGLWLEWCIDPGTVSVTEARTACYRLLENALGPI